MKKFILSILAVIGCFAHNPEKIEKLSAKSILQNTQGYFILSDHSYWKVINYSTRWRGISEWWNSTQLDTPEGIDCLPDDWFVGTEIEVYSKLDIQIFEENASNQEDLKRCTHVFINARTGEMLFAMALEATDFMTKLCADCNKEGYNKGYDKGYESCKYDNYRKGYVDGQIYGYKQGYEDGKKSNTSNSR